VITPVASGGGVWSGVVVMDELRYRTLARLAGDALLELRPYPVPVGQRSGDERRAVYVGVNRSGYACYAGRTRPSAAPADAAARRIRQHLLEASKRAEWCEYWTFPFEETADARDIDDFEPAVCARLGLPLRNQRWRHQS
jgi:hypothetical protein